MNSCTVSFRILGVGLQPENISNQLLFLIKIKTGAGKHDEKNRNFRFFYQTHKLL